MPRSAQTLAALLLAALPLSAQQVHVVDASDPGAYPDVQSAVDAAADGDLVLVRPGTYRGFVVAGKSLVITSDGPIAEEERPAIRFDVVVRDLGPGQEVVLRGFDVVSSRNTGMADPVRGALRIENVLGHVWVEWCVLRGSTGACLFQGGGTCVASAANEPGVEVVAASASFARCDAVGADGLVITDVGMDAAPGFRADASEVSLYNCVLMGGDGGNADDFPHDGGSAGDGLLVGGGGFAFASGCIVTGGAGSLGGLDFQTGQTGASSPGGDALHVEPGSLAWYLDCDLVPGPGPPNGTAPDGLPVAGSAVALEGQARVFKVTSPARVGDPITFFLRGVPGDRVSLYISPHVDPTPDLAVNGVLLPALPARVLDLGTLPASGELVFQRAVGSLGGAPYLHLYLQCVFEDVQSRLFAGGPTDLSVLPIGF